MLKKVVTYNRWAFAVLFAGMIAIFVLSTLYPSQWWGWAYGGFVVLWFVIAWAGALRIKNPDTDGTWIPFQ